MTAARRLGGWLRTPAGVVVTATSVLFALRAGLALARTGPVIFADEAGYLADARILSGGLPMWMGPAPFYRGGYPLLLAPLQGLADDPRTVYRLGLVLNAALAAALVPALHALLTRCLRVPRGPAAAAAVAGAVYPSVTALSQVAMSENLLFPLTALWLLAVGSLARGGPGAPLAAAACAAGLWAVHGRMGIAVAITAVLLSWLGLRRRLAPAAALAGLVVLGAGVAGAVALNAWLRTRGYAGRGGSETGAVLDAFDSPGRTLAALRNLVGQTWYLAAATFGLALMVAVAEGARALPRALSRRADARDLVAASALALTAGLLALSALQLSDVTRPDMIFYGRYAEPAVPALVAIGLVVLGERHRALRPLPLLGAVALWTATVAVLRSGIDPTVLTSRWNVAALPFVTGELGPPIVLGAAAVAVAGAVLLGRLVHRSTTVAAVGAIVLFVPTTAYVEHLPVLRSEHDVYPRGWSSPAAGVGARTDDVIGYDSDRFDQVGTKVVQWFLPDRRFVPFAGNGTAPPSALFVSDRGWGARHPGRPARILWIYAGRDQALWRSEP